MKRAIDKVLRDQQAGFRKERSCTDQIATLRMIIEQSIEWNSPLYINFIDFEKAFDSLDRETLWMIMAHYGIPPKPISIIRNMYEGMKCQVLHGADTSDEFDVKTGVRQGCLLSPFLFLLVIDWIMKETTHEKRNGIQWGLLKQLDDLDFADDIALLAHNHQQIQHKTLLLEENAAKTGLKINREKTKTMRLNNKSTDSIRLKSGEIQNVDSFIYLGSVINVHGGTEEDVINRISKARVTFSMLKKVWRSKEIRLTTKLKIFNSNVKSILLYGAETWSLTEINEARIQSFLNKCLRNILGIFWPEKIRNEDLWEKTKQIPSITQIKLRKWKWIGHTLRKGNANTTCQALRWTPQGKRKRGRPKLTWRRVVEKEMKEGGYSWGTLQQQAANRVR
jgi:urease beta subunit